jgi:hypothetical protein
MNDGARRAFRG